MLLSSRSRIFLAFYHRHSPLKPNMSMNMYTKLYTTLYTTLYTILYTTLYTILYTSLYTTLYTTVVQYIYLGVFQSRFKFRQHLTEDVHVLLGYLQVRPDLSKGIKNVFLFPSLLPISFNVSDLYNYELFGSVNKTLAKNSQNN